jgi:hypothetical protein
MPSKVPVYVRIEPPIKWPLWFDNEALDAEDITVISEELKAEGFKISALFVASTNWCSLKDCYFWLSRESLAEFRRRAKDYCAWLRSELGEGYAVHAVTGSVSVSGHAEIISESRLRETEGLWHAHQCPTS